MRTVPILVEGMHTNNDFTENKPAEGPEGAAAAAVADPSTSIKYKLDDTDETGPAKRVKTVDGSESATLDISDKAIELAALFHAPSKLVPAESRAKHIFPFQYLPTEIRLKVYGLLLKRNKPVCPQVANAPFGSLPRSGFPRGLVRSMVGVNKQMAQEVTQFIISNNCFFLSLRYHRDWLNHIGYKRSSLLQEVIVVCHGRPVIAATSLFSMISTLRKSARENLRRLTVRDCWNNMNRDFIVCQLLEFGATRSWRRFSKLKEIRIDIPHRAAPYADRPLYERLCIQAQVAIKAGHNYGVALPGPVGWNIGAYLWLQINPRLLEQRMEQERERAGARVDQGQAEGEQ